ncbi:MAG: hypothetical protein K9K86_04225 [Pseudomonadales bacterium]|nr:hypothetical protein [Pseudomonadales bacterium]
MVKSLNEQGLLDPGLHEFTLEEVGDTFGRARSSDKRPQLFAFLEKLYKHAISTGIVSHIVVDGSFVTDKAIPGDIDLILVVDQEMLENPDLTPYQLNLLSRHRAKKLYPFDILVASEGSTEYQEYVRYYSQIKQDPSIEKGLIRIECAN